MVGSAFLSSCFRKKDNSPSKALCDGPCALKLSELEAFLEQIFELDSLIKRI